MIIRDIDSFAARHPAFSRYAKERIAVFHDTGLGTNIACCTAASLAAGFFSHGDNSILFWAALAVMLAVWLFSSLLAGFLRQWLFVFFSALYFVLPQILILPPVGDESAAMSETQYFISDILEYIWAGTFTAVFPYISYITISYILFGIYILIFFAGVRLRTAAKHSGLYCKARLEQLN